MNIKLMTSALALSAVLAYGGVAFADPVIDSSEIDDSEVEFEDSFNDNSDNEWESEIEVEDSFNDNSDHSTEVEVEDSFNDNREWDSEVEVEDSFNDNREYDTEVEIEDSFNDEREWEYEDSFNSDSSTEVEDSYNDNSDHSTNTYDIRVSLNYQDLDASVSGIGIDMHDDGKGSQYGNMTSGGIQNQGGAFAGFAGIQTVTNNTGIASTNQAATAVSANANISFGGN